MHLEILTPQKKVFEGECTSVSLPGADGRFQLLNNHAALISSLQKGTVKVVVNNETTNFEVDGGVVEVLKNKVILLAEGVTAKA